MDAFGIGTALEGCAEIYFRSARKSGRTTAMVEAAKDGDRFVFLNSAHAKHAELMLKERNIKAECIVVSPKNPGSIFQRSTSKGRTVFDHSWLEEYWMQEIRHVAKSIDEIQTQSSGFGEKHYETRRKAEEIAKWRFK